MASQVHVGIGAVLSLNVTTNFQTATDTITSLATHAVTEVAEVAEINPDFTCGEADVTHLGSAGLSDFLPTRISHTIGVTVNFVTEAVSSKINAFGATSAAATNLLSQLYNRRVFLGKIAFPTNPSTSDPDAFYFRGFFTGLSPTVTTDEGMRASGTIRIMDSAIATATS